MTRTQVLIASPLEAELAARIQAADPRAEVLFEPELLPPARYPADHRGDPAFERDAEGEARWRALLDRAEVLLGVPGDSAEGLAEVVNGLPRLRWVHATSAGAGEQVHKAELSPEALERVAITTSSGVHAIPLAEFAVLGLLAVAKELPRLVEDQRARAWPEVRQPLRELSGQTLFLVGLGEIGREVARLGKALGMRTVGFRRTQGPPPEWVDEVHGPERLTELADQADAMVVSLPMTEQTAGLVDRTTIERLPASCIFVNVGRGGVVDEPALVDTLRDRRIAGAVLDVFATEPLPADSPLWTLPNVLVTPHAAALSARENERITELFTDNLRRFLDGRALRNVVEPGVYY
ncbi:MAG TPA: D-2-hydroxyacid dehydrogenase [Actinomycetota bacterium]|nr:D-2-hydroxyacid dehydrogenase [Actinomycetota bacterium]